MIPLIEMEVLVNKNWKINAIYDSGANISMMSYRFLKKIKRNEKSSRSTFRTINGIMYVDGTIEITLKIFEIEKKINIFVTKNINFKYDLLIGLDVISKFGLRQNEKLQIDQKFSEKQKDEKKNEIINLLEYQYHKDKYINNKLHNILSSKNIFATRNKYDVGLVKGYEALIRLTENCYVAKRPYRCSIPDQNEIDDQIKNLLKANLIETSSSPFAAPVTLAYKREERKKSRLCIDFRELNKIVVPEPQPFLLIEDIFAKTSGCSWFSTLDINSAFWSIPLHEKDRYKTAFETQNGHYQWRCLPFGLKTSLAIFQRILSNILFKKNLHHFCSVYIDDIIIFSGSLKEHIQHLESVLVAISDEGFRFKFEKCQFAQKSIKYLGHILEENSVRPLRDNLIAIRNFPVPQNKKISDNF